MPEQIVLTGRNLWIVDKKPQTFENISYENGVLSIGKEQIQLSKDVYAALFCEELRNITLIVQQGEIHQMTMVLESKESFDNTDSFLFRQGFKETAIFVAESLVFVVTPLIFIGAFVESFVTGWII